MFFVEVPIDKGSPVLGHTFLKENSLVPVHFYAAVEQPVHSSW